MKTNKKHLENILMWAGTLKKNEKSKGYSND